MLGSGRYSGARGNVLFVEGEKALRMAPPSPKGHIFTRSFVVLMMNEMGNLHRTQYFQPTDTSLSFMNYVHVVGAV
jgi:hypothetical protein